MSRTPGRDACVSVIVPTFGTDAGELRSTIESVLGQSMASLECIVVDDGSPEPFSGLESRIHDERLLWHACTENRGVSVARNAGIDRAGCDALAFLDAGDLWQPTKLQRQLEVFRRHGGRKVVYCGVRMRKDDRWRYIRPRHRGDLRDVLLVANVLTGSCSSVMVSREMIRRCGRFEESHDIPEDHDLWIRMAELYEFDFVDEPLVTIVSKEQSRSADPIRKSETYLALLARHRHALVERGLLDQAMANYARRIGALYRKRGAYGRSLSWSAVEASLDPSARSVLKCLVSMTEAVTRRAILEDLYYRFPRLLGGRP
jgi:glycosyltransferase involved in cell wall biosynthesis